MQIENITANSAYDHERRVNDFLRKIGAANVILPMHHSVNTVETVKDGEEKEELHYTTIITYRD